MGILAEIVENKKREIAELRARGGPPSLRDLGREPIDVVRALARPIGAPLRLITEIKFKSPSAGALSKKLDAAARAVIYARAGAAMISVLCDRHFFDGSYEDLESARSALDREKLAAPLLCKEFVLDEVQLDWARVRGADAVLLIARILEGEALARLVEAAVRRGLEPLVEVTSEEEIDRALATRARVFGVNARDLDTLKIDPKRAAELVARVSPERVALHFSGVKNQDDLDSVARGRADGALIGEVLMREDDPSALLASFVEASYV